MNIIDISRDALKPKYIRATLCRMRSSSAG